ncbi:MAG: S-layer homology domain-containing protein [Exilispira sp.]
MKRKIYIYIFLFIFILIINLSNIFSIICFAQTAPSIPSNFFTDVPQSHWAYEALLKLYQSGLITGYPDGTYKGNQPMSRYEIALIIYKLLIYLQSQIKNTGSTISNTNLTPENFDQIINEILQKSRISEEEIKIIKDLINEFKNELISMESQFKSLELRVEALEKNQTAFFVSIASMVVSIISIIIALLL